MYDFQLARSNLLKIFSVAAGVSIILAVVANDKATPSYATRESSNPMITTVDTTTTTTIATPPSTVLTTVAPTTSQVVVTYAPVTSQASVAVATTAAPTTTLVNACRYDNTHRYTVEQGDSLYGIAAKYNTSVDDLISCNDFNEKHIFFSGDRIILPPDSKLDEVVTQSTSAPTTTQVVVPDTTAVVETTTITAPAETVPVTHAEPVQQVSGDRSTHPQCWWESHIRSAFAIVGASIEQQDYMVYVAWRESRCTETAHNGNRATRDDSYGIFQLNLLPGALGPLMNSWGYGAWNLLDGATNIEAAAKLFSYCNGYGPWVPGKYYCNR